MIDYGTVGHWDTEKKVMSNTNQVELIVVGLWDRAKGEGNESRVSTSL